MVSKVAVIALVAIVACPILLGYGMNLQEVTITDYEQSNDSVNVTPLLQNGISYSYAYADLFKLNTNVKHGDIPSLPIYEGFTSNASSLFLQSGYSSGQPWNIQLNILYYYSLEVTGNTASDYVYVNIYELDENDVSTLITTLNKVTSIYYDDQSKTVKVVYNTPSYTEYTVTLDKIFLEFGTAGTFTGHFYVQWWYKYVDPSTAAWVDFSAGFHFVGEPNAWWIEVPTNTRSMILTIDLDSITDSTYSCNISTASASLVLYKETSLSGDVSWGYYPTTDPDDKTVIYYDNDRTSNVYQMVINVEKIKEDSLGKYFKTTIQFRYIGNWPDYIGESNYYQTFDYEFDYVRSLLTPDSFVNYINLNSASNGITPRVRVDAAEFRAFEYQVIQNQTYKPSDFKSNPSTTIKDVVIYGSSFTFGGHTYTVNNGNIRIDSKDIPVDGLTLSSILTDAGYENRIGNTVVSTTVSPSTIVFDGSWLASISTATLTETTHTETKWVAGSFGWDGLDHNFLIVGLLASVGAFIAIAIYARTSNKTLWPALIVCGAAAMLFFAML